mgnify:CR=1 FL=1
MAQFSLNEITKSNPNRWFFVSDVTEMFNVFGYAGDVNVSEVVTGQANIGAFLTEDELEVYVDTETGIANYYKDAVENSSDEFQGPSGKYTPIIPEPEIEEPLVE